MTSEQGKVELQKKRQSLRWKIQSGPPFCLLVFVLLSYQRVLLPVTLHGYQPAADGAGGAPVTRRAAGCLIHNLEVAQCSRARAACIHYSCFLLNSTLPAMKIKDPLLDEDQ